MWNLSVTSTAVVFYGPVCHIVLIFLLLFLSLWVLLMGQAHCKHRTSPISNPLHLSLWYIVCCKCALIRSLSMRLTYCFAFVLVVIRSSLFLPLVIFPLTSLLPIITFSFLPSFSITPSTKTTYSHLSLCPTSLSKTAWNNTAGVQPGGPSCHHRPPIT